jgi:hypothetical protein
MIKDRKARLKINILSEYLEFLVIKRPAALSIPNPETPRYIAKDVMTVQIPYFSACQYPNAIGTETIPSREDNIV